MLRPQTRYTRSGEVHIAYQVIGKGPLDLLMVPGWVSNAEYAWEDPAYARFLHGLSTLGRLILFDKRGTGLSDRGLNVPTLDERMEDALAVLQAAGARQPVVFGVSEGCGMSALFAATYPEHVAGLVLYAPVARAAWAADYPWMPTTEQWQRYIAGLHHRWGGPVDVRAVAPSEAGDPRFRRRWASALRFSASPGAAIALQRMNVELDIREILGAIRVPALVLQRSGDRIVRPENGRYVAWHMTDARYVELEDRDHLWWVGDSAALLSELERFVGSLPERREPAAALRTVLGVEWPASAARPVESAELCELFDARSRLARAQIERFGGHELPGAATQSLAAFEGPVHAVRCACSIRDEARRLRLEPRSGLQVGLWRRGATHGPPAEAALRIAAAAAPGEVLVSSALRGLLGGTGLSFEPRQAEALPDLGTGLLAVTG
jgi:pimeloyl-ACP methyl ester carboxylesterase